MKIPLKHLIDNNCENYLVLLVCKDSFIRYGIMKGFEISRGRDGFFINWKLVYSLFPNEIFKDEDIRFPINGDEKIFIYK